jgi:hypothetical protein
VNGWRASACACARSLASLLTVAASLAASNRIHLASESSSFSSSSSWSSWPMASPSSWPSAGRVLQLLGVAALSHQCRHPGGFPSLSVSDGNDRLLMVARR